LLFDAVVTWLICAAVPEGIASPHGMPDAY
jgi:hypothetical protein